MGTQYRALFTISMFILFICITITLLSVKEVAIPTTNKMENPFKKIYLGIINMPTEVSRVCAVQFFSWIAWFTFILFITDWVGEAVFGGDPYAPEDSPAKNAFDDGVRHGALALGCNAILTILMSAALPKIVKTIGIRIVFFSSQIILATCLILTFWIKSKEGAICLILVCGIPWAVTMVLPFTIVGEAVATHESGLYMGALNIFVVIPQILVSLFIPFVIALFDKKVEAALFVGGIFAIIAALFTLRLIMPIRLERVTGDSIPFETETTSLLKPDPAPTTYSGLPAH